MILQFDASRNVVKATQEYLTIALGYTALDIFIILWIPYVHLASTIFYTISFKNRTKDISQVCLEMTKVKTFLGNCLIETNSKENKSSTRISLRLVVLAVLVALMTILLYRSSIYLTMGTIGSAWYMTRAQMWILVINNAIQSVCWIYPFMSISADLMTCHILEDMGKIYLNWNKVLKMDLKKQDMAQTSLDHHFMLNEGDNSRLTGLSNLSSRVDKYIDDSEGSQHPIEESKDNSEYPKRKLGLLTGISLFKITRLIEKAFGGIILNTYINCLLQATSSLYAGSSFFFNNTHGIQVYTMSGVCLLLTFISILRLLYYTKAGQYLATSMDECVETLTEIQINSHDDAKCPYLKIMKQDLKDKAISPISPFSAFSLSNNTLIGTFATILTYLIVLIQFKAAENQDKDKLLIEVKEMLGSMNNTLSDVLFKNVTYTSS